MVLFFVYRYSTVFETVILCKVNKTKKSIRVAQLALKPPSLVLSGSKVERPTSLFLDALKLTRLFWINFYFFYETSVQLSSFYRFGKVDSFQTRFWNTAFGVYSRAGKK